MMVTWWELIWFFWLPFTSLPDQLSPRRRCSSAEAVWEGPGSGWEPGLGAGATSEGTTWSSPGTGTSGMSCPMISPCSISLSPSSEVDSLSSSLLVSLSSKASSSSSFSSWNVWFNLWYNICPNQTCIQPLKENVLIIYCESPSVCLSAACFLLSNFPVDLFTQLLMQNSPVSNSKPPFYHEHMIHDLIKRYNMLWLYSSWSIQVETSWHEKGPSVLEGWVENATKLLEIPLLSWFSQCNLCLLICHTWWKFKHTNLLVFKFEMRRCGN